MEENQLPPELQDEFAQVMGKMAMWVHEQSGARIVKIAIHHVSDSLAQAGAIQLDIKVARPSEEKLAPNEKPEDMVNKVIADMMAVAKKKSEAPKPEDK